MSTSALSAIVAALQASSQPAPPPSDPVVLTSALNSRLSTKLDATQAAFAAFLDTFPVMPADPANYPAAGGLFRDGDANGYRLVRIFTAS